MSEPKNTNLSALALASGREIDDVEHYGAYAERTAATHAYSPDDADAAPLEEASEEVRVIAARILEAMCAQSSPSGIDPWIDAPHHYRGRCTVQVDGDLDLHAIARAAIAAVQSLPSATISPLAGKHLAQQGGQGGEQ